ncbi:MAG: alternative ribosome rescue aminoacyl-tRNA hydrolase ArfB [Actinobacteria bacterium]|nr:alternative ribosome rescue aminoacyl-tRNA hydrolase ArfB [Actinomycetota bacterium]MDA3017344.1 alternative ribosome rescue aminoacyl-tRNA hydrolase ArfB [Actinomycetota bacterium]
MKPDEDLRTTRGLVVPSAALRWSFARSGGAGGQHINKTSSKATLTVAINEITGPEVLVRRVTNALSIKVRVTNQTSRSQWRNRQFCLTQLIEIIDNAAKPPTPDRRKSKPTRASVKRRLDGKRHASKKKESRRISDW